MDQSFRSQLVAKRTYCRPGEAWGDVVTRVVEHQRWLWERAQGGELQAEQIAELAELKQLMFDRVALPSGRILWMGGTEQAKKSEIAMFNCAFQEVRDVFSAVDAFYLLLNGCGVGFKPVAGLLNGFAAPCGVEVIRSERTTKGNPENHENFYRRAYGDGQENVWHLTVGDSGIAWAKAFGKILAMKTPVDRVILDFSEIRPSGEPLAGYGWLSSGDSRVAEAFEQIVKLLASRHDELLTEIDILDIMNLVGTTLTSRRSAQIAMLHAHHNLAEEFADAKRDHFENGMPWRSQSNNSLVFWKRPSKLELRGLFQRMLDAGGSEPGLYNGEAARRRAEWFTGTNPCGEILLPDGGLCNLVEVDLAKVGEMHREDQGRVFELIARANYRQTCVQLKDGVLSDRWHETNQFLRLCGVGITGITRWLDSLNEMQTPSAILDRFRRKSIVAANYMALELGLPMPKAVTTVKPSGTLGKLMDTTEGLHRPLGRFVFNNIQFSKHDPLIPRLREAGYFIFNNPYNTEELIVRVPVDNGEGQPLYNVESAIHQLERYRLVMNHWVDHNASVTISYDPDEIPAIVNWLYENWDDYVGVSFILRTDPTKTAADLGYPYLPQQVVDEETFNSYVSLLKPVDLVGSAELDFGECEGGACPVR